MSIFKRLYQYRELLKTSIKKDVGGKYKNSFLGVIWSFINPLLQICVYAIVFPLIMRNKMENYTVFMVCGLIPWTFFSTVINRSSFVMIENGNILKKVYFPREILPISIVTSEAITFMISTLIIIGFVVATGVGISAHILFYPLLLLAQYVLLIGISFIVSSITVYFRDLQHFIGVFLQLLFYGTPIVYSLETIPEQFRWILKLNPMTYIIEGYRDIFYYKQMPNLQEIFGIIGIGLVVIVIGYMIFNKLQKRFAEEL